MENPVVIVNPQGEFLRSAVFVPSPSGETWAARARWVSEYPDCAEYTVGEARLIVRKLRDAGMHCRGILRYGFEDEAVVA